jgi:hypothetical protein
MNHERKVIGIDGKTVRGARARSTAGVVEATEAGRAPHLVAAFDHTAGAVLGQVAVAAKSNEIPAVQRLLGLFDLTGTVTTVDAMHTQTDTARQITTAEIVYLITSADNRAAHQRRSPPGSKDTGASRTKSGPETHAK